MKSELKNMPTIICKGLEKIWSYLFPERTAGLVVPGRPVYIVAPLIPCTDDTIK